MEQNYSSEQALKLGLSLKWNEIKIKKQANYLINNKITLQLYLQKVALKKDYCRPKVNDILMMKKRNFPSFPPIFSLTSSCFSSLLIKKSVYNLHREGKREREN